jgi:hypothetical protein
MAAVTVAAPAVLMKLRRSVIGTSKVGSVEQEWAAFVCKQSPGESG